MDLWIFPVYIWKYFFVFSTTLTSEKHSLDEIQTDLKIDLTYFISIPGE